MYTNSKAARSLDIYLTKVWMLAVVGYSFLKSSISLIKSGNSGENKNVFFFKDN